MGLQAHELHRSNLIGTVTCVCEADFLPGADGALIVRVGGDGNSGNAGFEQGGCVLPDVARAMSKAEHAGYADEGTEATSNVGKIFIRFAVGAQDIALHERKRKVIRVHELHLYACVRQPLFEPGHHQFWVAPLRYRTYR